VNGYGVVAVFIAGLAIGFSAATSYWSARFNSLTARFNALIATEKGRRRDK